MWVLVAGSLVFCGGVWAGMYFLAKVLGAEDIFPKGKKK